MKGKAANDFNGVETLCLFLGYPRSGHSLIGSILDAHPNALISQELDFIKFYNCGFSKKQLYYLIKRNSEILAKKGRTNTGYNYTIMDAHQGNYTNLQVIGDKKGSLSVKRLIRNNNLNEVNALNKLAIIHVIRNPFDTIATMMKWQKKSDFQYAFESYRENAVFMQQLLESNKFTIYNLYFERFINCFDAEIKELCFFLNLSLTDHFVLSTKKVINSQPNRSRFTAHFSEEQKSRINAMIAEISFLNSYNFDN